MGAWSHPAGPGLLSFAASVLIGALLGHLGYVALFERAAFGDCAVIHGIQLLAASVLVVAGGLVETRWGLLIGLMLAVPLAITGAHREQLVAVVPTPAGVEQQANDRG